MFCNNCGYKLCDNSKFCGNCGKELSVVRTQNKRTCSKVETIILIIIIAIISFRFLYMDNLRILEIFDKDSSLIEEHPHWVYWSILLLLTSIFNLLVYTVVAYIAMWNSIKLALIGGMVNFSSIIISYCYSGTFSYISYSSALDLFDICIYPFMPLLVIGCMVLFKKFIIKNRELLGWVMIVLSVYVVNAIIGLVFIVLFPNELTEYITVLVKQYYLYNLLIVVFYTFVLWIIKFICTKNSTQSKLN